MHKTTCEAEQAIIKQDWYALGRLMNIYQGLMDALGVNDYTLSDIIYTMRASADIYGAKISGSGLGDCVIALGMDVTLPLDYESIPVAISESGVTVHVD
jgi:mevalonate kinase